VTDHELKEATVISLMFVGLAVVIALGWWLP